MGPQVETVKMLSPSLIALVAWTLGQVSQQSLGLR